MNIYNLLIQFNKWYFEHSNTIANEDVHKKISRTIYDSGSSGTGNYNYYEDTKVGRELNRILVSDAIGKVTRNQVGYQYLYDSTEEDSLNNNLISR